MNEIIEAAHNIIRWVVVLVALLALARAYMGWLGRREWTPADRRAGVLFGSAMDVQLLLGIILIFLNGGFGAMGVFLMEHILPMVVAVVLVHVGSILARRAEGDTSRHRMAAIFYTLALLVVLVAIPWRNSSLLPGI
jgi:hypothetical protein